MPPRIPRLRDRKTLQTPKRFQDGGCVYAPPRQVLYEESRQSSDLEEDDIYESPEPKKPKTKRSAYRGKVTEFNPNLPPAAFPTLDHPDYVHNGGHIAIDLQSGLQSREPKDNVLASGRGFLPENIHLTEAPIRTSTNVNSTRQRSPNIKHSSMTIKEQSPGTMLSSMLGEVTDNGPRNPIWTSNMARMAEAGRMSDSDRLMLEMQSSDEENPAANPTKRACMDDITEAPAWDDLTVAHKLDLTDTVAELYSDRAQAMNQLRLGVSQKKELVGLLAQRSDREAREKASQQRLQKQTKDALLSGRSFSQQAFQQILNETLYENINKDDHLQTNLKELEKARRYLRYCDLNPTLADKSWNIPSKSKSAGGTRAMPAQRKLEENKADQSVPNYSEESLRRRPSVSALSQNVSNPTGSCVEPVHQDRLRQDRPTPTHSLIRQHSPPAPLSKVPSRSFRIAPTGHCSDPRVRYQGTTLLPQPSRSAVQKQLNVSTGADGQALVTALSYAIGTPSVSSNSQEEQSLLKKPYSLPPKNREIHEGQISANSNAGPTTPQRDWDFIRNQVVVNKKKRKIFMA